MTLHIEDEFLLPELGRGDLAVQGRIGGKLEESARASSGGMRGVEGEERGGRAATRDQEFAAALADPFRELGGALGRQGIGASQRIVQRDRREFAVRGRVELDGEPAACRIAIVSRRHESTSTTSFAENANQVATGRSQRQGWCRSVLSSRSGDGTIHSGRGVMHC